MTNITITGASGFVGENLVGYLNQTDKYQLSVLNRKHFESEIIIDSETDVIIHLAGKAHDLKGVSNPDEYYQVNTDLTKRLYNAFLKSSATKFIFMSSVKAAADTVDGELTEDVIPKPETHYGKSKLFAEQYIQQQALPKNKSYYILRPCMIHGPGNKGNLNLLYQFVKKSIPYPLAAFNNKRSFLSVENLCFVIKKLIDTDNIPEGTYNLADENALSVTQVVDVLASTLNKKPALWRVPPGIIKCLAKLGDIFHLPLTSDRLGKLTENYVVNSKKIKQALKQDFPLTAIQGLELTANSFKDN